MIKDFCEWLEDNTSFTVGSDLFAGFWNQDTPEQAVLVRESGGTEKPHSKIRRMQTFQVLTRALDYHDSRTDLYTIYDLFKASKRGELTLLTIVSGETWIIESISALAPPQYIGEDEKRRHVLSTNYTAHAKVT